MWDVFISYARDDRGLAEPIKQRLESLGLSVFFDIDGSIDAGDSFPQRIADAVAHSRVLLAIWTPNALAREWCRREAFLARQLGTLLPVAVQPIGPTDLKEFIDASYESLIDYSGQDKHFGWSQTLASIGRRLHALALDGGDQARLEHIAQRLLQEAQKVRPTAVTSDGDALGLTSAGAIWERLRDSADRADLLRFAETFPGTVEAFEARRCAAGASSKSVTGRSVREIWMELSASDDAQDVQRFADTFSGVAEGLEARRRIAYLSARKEAYNAIWEQVAQVCFATADDATCGEIRMRDAATAARSVAANVRAFNAEWSPNPWSEELSWLATRLERSADVNLCRAQAWEQARRELLKDWGDPPWRGWSDMFSIWDWWHKVTYVLIVTSTILVLIPLSATAFGSMVHSFIAGFFCALLLYGMLWAILAFLWSAEGRYRDWVDRRDQAEISNDVLWQCNLVQRDIVDTLGRFKSERGEFVWDVLWPDEHVLLTWANGYSENRWGDSSGFEAIEADMESMGFMQEHMDSLTKRSERYSLPAGPDPFVPQVQMQILQDRVRTALSSIYPSR